VIDDGGTTIWTDSPGFAAVKARILRPPPLVKDLISQLRDTPGKSIVKIKVGDAKASNLRFNKCTGPQRRKLATRAGVPSVFGRGD